MFGVFKKKKGKIKKKEIVIKSKRISESYDYKTDVVTYDFLPTCDIFSEIIIPFLEEFNLNLENKMYIKVISNTQTKIVFEIIGCKNYVDDFLDKLTCNPDMIKYAQWSF